jgi:hypothetical protein
MVVTLLILLVYFLVINLFIIGTGLGLGFLLNWLLPTINFSVAVLIGVVSAGISVGYLIRTFLFAESLRMPAELEEGEQERGMMDVMMPPSRSGGKRRKKWRIE